MSSFTLILIILDIVVLVDFFWRYRRYKEGYGIEKLWLIGFPHWVAPKRASKSDKQNLLNALALGVLVFLVISFQIIANLK